MEINSFLKAIFKGPKYSLAPIHVNNRGNCKIGEIIPVYARTVGVGHKLELDCSHLVRFLPTEAPTMEGYQVTFDAFAVPMVSLGFPARKERDIMDFFNVKTNDGEIVNPFSRTWRQLSQIGTDDNVSRHGLAHWFELGSLADYMNFPSMKMWREKLRDWIDSTPLGTRDFVITGDFGNNSLPLATILLYEYLLNSFSAETFSSFSITFNGVSGEVTALASVPFSLNRVNYNVDYENGSWDDTGNYFGNKFISGASDSVSSFALNGIHSLFRYICDNYPLVKSYYFDSFSVTFSGTITTNWSSISRGAFESLAARWNTAFIGGKLNLNYLEVLYQLYKIDSQTIFIEWFEYIFALMTFREDIRNADNKDLMHRGVLPNVFESTKPIDLSFFAAYWKIISDWYINTNIDGDPETFFLSKCKLLTDSEFQGVNLTPFKRRWSNDIFTSAVPGSQSDNVRIPVDGTIPDLRESNAWQKLRDLFRNTGNRLRDVVFGLIGIRPSAMASEMAVPIGSVKSWVGFQSILQTSQTTSDSPQANYAGIATDSSGDRHILRYINNEQPCPVIVMVLMHVCPIQSYFQGMPRKFMNSSIYDFPIPQLANIGEQEVYNSELFFDYAFVGDQSHDSTPFTEIFGFNRRYYQWFYEQSEVHGDLRDTLDYWHSAREFDNEPSLNSEFIGINAEKDHLQRMFSNISESARPILYNVRFDGAAVVDLPRYIQYEL